MPKKIVESGFCWFLCILRVNLKPPDITGTSGGRQVRRGQSTESHMGEKSAGGTISRSQPSHPTRYHQPETKREILLKSEAFCEAKGPLIIK